MGTSIDASIERLEQALRHAGLDAPSPPVGTEVLDEIEAAVSPYALPGDLRGFWERLDPTSIKVATFPDLTSPSFALSSHRSHLEPGAFPFLGPPVLFPIAYSSHEFRSIELTSPWNDGGTVFEWANDDPSPFRIEYRSLTDLIEVLAELIEEGVFERFESGYAHVDLQAEQDKRSARLDAAGPHPLYGEARELTNDLMHWPAHWLDAAGIDLRTREPLGATHTIAELMGADQGTPVHARIAGQVVRLVASGAGALVLVDDGTGQIDVWCPAGTSPWGPVHRRRFEFAVTAEGAPARPADLDAWSADVQRHALAGELEAAQAAATDFYRHLEHHTPRAVASDIRPLNERWN